ncbi:MAG TPA: hypothetical protein VEC01_08465 [Noviherbaspirillum sp.]|uniref:hypothetical protein n=1 Tax=Noviherbaspirillum sp. TaxID=1926288 RepID=UPI002D25887A|nr:hypothetical protein [Noviherbaspirillum sp.]HYD95345.1 hypothetical protein [Noviherbaspirillum sp.]
MDALDWDVSATNRQRTKRQVRRKNEAFRRGVQQRKKARRVAALKMWLASGAAVVSWSVAGFQLLR